MCLKNGTVICLKVGSLMCLKVGKSQTRIGMVSYSNMARSDFFLGQYFEISEILPLIWAMDYMAGLTNTADGIDEMREMFRQ